MTSVDDFDKPLDKTARNQLKFLDVIGRETIFKQNIPLIYLYRTGRVEKGIKMEQ